MLLFPASWNTQESLKKLQHGTENSLFVEESMLPQS